MLDIRFIREHADIVKEAARKKRVDVDVDRLLAVDDDRKRLGQEVEGKRAEQNKASKLIALAKGDEREKLIEAMQQLKKGMADAEDALGKVMEEWQKLMLMIPNVPDMTVPEGESGEPEVQTQSQTQSQS